MKLSEIFTAAADKIEQPGAWTKGTLDRTEDGYKTSAFSNNATCWCAVGAIASVCRYVDYGAMDFIEDEVLNGNLLGVFNDSQTDAKPVVDAMRLAAAKAKEFGQ